MPDPFQQALDAWQAGDLPATFEAINLAMQSPAQSNPALFDLLGDVLSEAGMPAEAAEAYEAAAARAPDGGFASLKRAVAAWSAAGDEEKAFLLALKAQKLDPSDMDMVFVLVKGLKLRDEKELLSFFQNKLTASDKPEHLQLAAELINADNRNPNNLALFKKLLRHDPDDHYTRFKLMSVAREFCDYQTVAEQEAWLQDQVDAGREWVFEGETHFANLLHCADERLNRLATNNISIKGTPPAAATQARRSMPHRWNERIRIGYLSNDFGSTHATMRLLRNVLELHDTSRFDVTLYCYTSEDHIASDDGGRNQWGRIVTVGDLSDAATADRMRQDGIDITVDLKGHTGKSRSQILNFPAAPVHVAWLGFPGSTTRVDVDYVIGDRFVLPDSSRPHYHEKIVRMPASYQPNDRRHRPLPAAATRNDLGLPADKIVLASFNSNRKITRHTLDLWIAVMRRVPTSVLWVMLYHDLARSNFRDYLAASGISPDRLIFADAVPYEEHLARVQAADLGLDTFPYNGHTTTSDMLWAGLPVLTKRGSNFASRVSESLLNAVGLPELVAGDDRDFVDLAVDLAENSDRRANLREKLVLARPTAPLFDPEAFCTALESAFTTMIDRARNGLPPEHFDVSSPISARSADLGPRFATKRLG
jgi:predicted O-linked N-acetylglucosamine transferase (SPINDLY family)